jgi:hypothetical protein
MADFFAFLLLLSLLGLIFGKTSSKLLSKMFHGQVPRKKARLWFGGATILFFVAYSVTAPPEPSTTANTAPTVTLTGYGALQSDWDAHHTRDSRFDGMVYNPTANTGTDDQHNDKYYMVSTSDNRITSYTMRLPNQSTQAAAQAEAMKEFPSDVSVQWQAKKDVCYQVGIKSSLLATQLGAKPIGDTNGQVLIEFQTDSAASSSLNSAYDATNVNLAILTLGSYNTANDAPGC